MQYGNPNFANTAGRRSPFTDFAAMLNRSGNPGGFGTQQMQGNQVQPPKIPNSMSQAPGVTNAGVQQPPAGGLQPYNYQTPLRQGQGTGTEAFNEFMYQSLPYYDSLLSLNQQQNAINPQLGDLYRQMGDLYRGNATNNRLFEMLRMAQQARPNSGTYYFAGY